MKLNMTDKQSQFNEFNPPAVAKPSLCEEGSVRQVRKHSPPDDTLGVCSGSAAGLDSKRRLYGFERLFLLLSCDTVLVCSQACCCQH